MSILKPFRRIARPFTDGGWMTNDQKQYFNDSRNAADRTGSIRAMRLLDDSAQRIFDFVEPTDDNSGCYSHELYALLLRACTEFESNAKMILTANGYKPSKGRWNVEDYCKLELAMKLSEYSVTVSPWRGDKRVIQPFAEWKVGHTLGWYKAYNNVKHARHEHFPEASVENAVLAVGATLILLFAQFNMYAFDADHATIYFVADSSIYSHPRSSFSLRLPTSWQESEMYSFDWISLMNDSEPFSKYDFGYLANEVRL